MTTSKRGCETVVELHRFPPFPHRFPERGNEEGGRFPLDPPKGGRRGNDPLPQSGGFRGETNRVSSTVVPPDVAYMALGELACRELEAEDRRGWSSRPEPLSAQLPPRRQSAQPRRFGCPGCGQAKGLSGDGGFCQLCGWSVRSRVGARWSADAKALFEARAYELARDGEQAAERIAFEELRGECDG